MTDQKCKSADTCTDYASECRVPHKFTPRCFVWPPPTMMICQEWQECTDKSCGLREPHALDCLCTARLSCWFGRVVCIPVEPEPQPVGLDEIRQNNQWCLPSSSARATVDEMCDEIERLRDRLELYDSETLPRLESAESRVVRLEMELGATMEQRDDASDRLDASREAGRVMEAQRDHWRGKYRKANQEVGAAFNRGIATSSNAIPDKLWSRVCDIAFGSEWTNDEALCKLVQRGLDCAGDGCGAMIDELHARLAQAHAMHCASDDDPDAGRLLPDMHCSGWVECTVLHCKLISAHNIGSHVNCGLSHYCVSFEEDVRCVEVTG